MKLYFGMHPVCLNAKLFSFYCLIAKEWLLKANCQALVVQCVLNSQDRLAFNSHSFAITDEVKVKCLEQRSRANANVKFYSMNC